MYIGFKKKKNQKIPHSRLFHAQHRITRDAGESHGPPSPAKESQESISLYVSPSATPPPHKRMKYRWRTMLFINHGLREWGAGWGKGEEESRARNTAFPGDRMEGIERFPSGI